MHTATAANEVTTWIAETGKSVVGYSAAAALACGTAIIGNVTVHPTGDVDMVVNVAHPSGTTVLTMVDGRFYDRHGFPLADTDSVIVMVHTDAVLGHRDTPYPITRSDAAGPIRYTATVAVRDYHAAA